MRIEAFSSLGSGRLFFSWLMTETAAGAAKNTIQS